MLPLSAPPTGANAATDPGVTGVFVVVGVKLGVIVIGGGAVGVAVRVMITWVGSKPISSVDDSTAVAAGVSVATIGTTCGGGVAVM